MGMLEDEGEKKEDPGSFSNNWDIQITYEIIRLVIPFMEFN